MGDEEDRKLADSAEMRNLVQALEIVKANAMHRVMRGTGADARISQAEIEVNRLVNEANLAGNHKCPKGTIWDESQRRCIPIG